MVWYSVKIKCFRRGRRCDAPLNAEHIHLVGYKKWGKEIIFVYDLEWFTRNPCFGLIEPRARRDLAMSKSLEHNRSLNPSGTDCCLDRG